MMVTVAGLPMWKHYSRAVALGMPLQACQIMSKSDMGEGKKKRKRNYGRILLAINTRLHFVLTESDAFSSLTSQT